MDFHVPQFIEMESKIVGPLTWKQFLLLGGAGAVLFILWFIVSKFLWFIIAIILGGATVSLAFLKIQGHPFPTILKNFLTFSVSSRIYLWQQKKFMPKIIYRKEKIKLEKDISEETPILKVSKKSRLKDLSNQLELKTK